MTPELEKEHRQHGSKVKQNQTLSNNDNNFSMVNLVTIFLQGN